MSISFSLEFFLQNALRQAANGLWPEVDFDPLVRVADPRNGDFQANGVLPLAKSLKQPPRPLATALAEALAANAPLAEAFTWEVAGPGFLNFSFRPEWLGPWLQGWTDAPTIRASLAQVRQPQRVVVDFSSPNTAKQMHVGHIRSTVIGESIARLLAFFGDEVIRDNHLGDWGTGFGILLMAMRREGVRLDDCGEEPLAFIEELYKRGNALAESDPEAKEEARQAILELQQGDPAATEAWKAINALSYAAFEKIYNSLGVHFDHVLGESFYRDRVDAVCAELESCGLAEESQGALVIFHPEHPRFKDQPFLIRKANGASNYATTDLATILYRFQEWKADRILYVVDSRQSDHFEQLFLSAEKWFKATGRPLPGLQHISFGTILGKDGRAIKTRSGAPVRLAELLAEAVRRAEEVVAEKNPELDAAARSHIAQVVGINAVRYADLSQNRTSDYTFDWDKLLSFEGNTAPYLLYAATRIHGIFRKMGLAPDADLTMTDAFETPGEIRLARKLGQFGAILEIAREDLRPHTLGTYLFELAGAFSSFYDSDKVAVEEEGIRNRRLLLCQKTLLFLTIGLDLLGIPTLERM
jgi:arginyl-tRNA synthetase